MNSDDPNGLFTIGFCGGFGVNAAAVVGLAYSGDVCLVRTVFTPKHNDDIGFTVTGETDWIWESWRKRIIYRTAVRCRVSESIGWALYQVSGTVDDGIGGTMSVFGGFPKSQELILGGNIGVAFGVGATISVETTDTSIYQQNNTVVANIPVPFGTASSESEWELP